MALIGYCEAAPLGALPELHELEWSRSQQWQSTSSFCDLGMGMDIEMTDSGTSSWVGCHLLLADAEDDEFSSKLLSQEFGLPHPITTTIAAACEAFHHPIITHSHTSTSSLQQQLQQQCSASQSVSEGASLGSLPASQCSPPASPASASRHSMHSSSPAMLAAAAAALLPVQGSRAGTPEPDFAHDAPPAGHAGMEDADAETVCIAALALQMSQGDVNGAISQLLNWASAN